MERCIKMDEELKVQWDYDEYEYYVIVPIGKQKLKMAINFFDRSDTTIYGNIYIQLYTKRKHRQYEMDNCIMTGLNPLQTVSYGIRAFKLLENAALRGYNENYIVNLSCCWTNNTRRDAYHSFLSKRGYRFENLFGKKVLMKVWKKGEYQPEGE